LSGQRKLGPVLATIIVAGNMIGSGIFLLPATLAGVGSVTVIGWVVASFGALALATLFAKLARRKPMAGGPATYVFDAFGPFAGSQASLWYWASCLIGNIAIATAASGYLAALFGFEAGPALLAFITIALLWLITGVNLVSPRFVGQVDGPLLVAGLVPILLVATAGWWMFDSSQFAASWNVSGMPVYQAVPHSLVLVFWAFTGLESASVAAAVVKDPERNVPIATLAGVLIAALLYIAASAAMMGLAPASELASSTAPFALVAARLLGPGAFTLVACAGMLKALGTLAGWVLMSAQVSRAAADHGLLPQFFARTRAGDTPVRHGHDSADDVADTGTAVRPADRGFDHIRAADLSRRLRGGAALSAEGRDRAGAGRRGVLRIRHRLVQRARAQGHRHLHGALRAVLPAIQAQQVPAARCRRTQWHDPRTPRRPGRSLAAARLQGEVP
jgi:arginine:agmatine antiporter